MILLPAASLSLVVLAAVAAVVGQAANGRASEAEGRSGAIRITRSGTQPPRKGPSENFTGSVRVDPLFEPADPPHASGAAVTFDPGARSAWHTHPAGQILIVTAGVGRVQGWGGPIEEIRAGDVAWTPPGQKHWHGASPTTGMTHIAIQEPVGGKTVDWMEHVTNEQYNGTAAAKGPSPMPTLDEVRKVAPALERYTRDVLLGGVWKRPHLSPRDRSLVTVAALIARNQTIEMPYYFDLALANGVKPAELAETITHLAFYSGWGNAMAAVAVASDVFAKRNIGPDQLPPAAGTLLPIDAASEAQRAARVAADVGPVSPGLEQYTGDVLFHDLWLRPALAPRDRSLVTVSALIASGQLAQLPSHLNRAMDNGLTKAEASELLAHLPFYAGWPNAFSAVPVVKAVLESRPK